MNGPEESAPQPIAWRVYELAPDQEVMLLFFTPVPDGDDWACEFEIRWPDRTTRPPRIMGIDPVQALVSAIGLAKVHLSASAEGKAGRLAWFGDQSMGFGLPDLPASNVPPAPQIGS